MAVVATKAPLKAPFPWFGGKSKVARLVWDRLGDVDHYIEPFAGSLAVLLARPFEHMPAKETVNDLDGYVTNFWRAVRHDPDSVVEYADWPVSECDLTARHWWLVTEGKPDVERLHADLTYHDPRAAGYWLWGLCVWIGSGWCSGEGAWRVEDGRLVKGACGPSDRKRPRLSAFNEPGTGINRALARVTRKRPFLTHEGVGINNTLPGVTRQRPFLGSRDKHYGQGINRRLYSTSRRDYIASLLEPLAERLRDVRICCGDWSRVVGSPSVLYGGESGRDIAGVFLDPPYLKAIRHDGLYSTDTDPAVQVREWCRASGDNPRLRIALCGYEGEHDELEQCGWSVVPWKAHGGMGNAGNGRGRENAHRERIWFSPHCLTPGATAARPPDLFA